MGAYIGTLIALYAVFWDPLRDIGGNAALLKGGAALWQGSVGPGCKCRDRELVAALRIDRNQNLFHKFGQIRAVGIDDNPLTPCLQRSSSLPGSESLPYW